MRSVLLSPISLSCMVALAFVAGLLAPGGVVVDAELRTLLRFMAVIKGGMALAAAALVAWRLRRPVSGWGSATAFAAVALMAGATGLIWSLAHVALGAVLFHVGLLALLLLAWREGLAGRLALPRRPPLQRRATVTATSFLRRNGSVQGGS